MSRHISWRTPDLGSLVFLLLVAAAIGQPAGATGTSHYGVTISRKATQNMVFSAGVYSATADGANLNTKDLESVLAAGNVEVTTGNGSGGDEKGDLHVDTGFTWKSRRALTLDAYHSIFVDSPAVDAGKGALTLTDNDGGSGGAIVYGPKGRFIIRNISDRLVIDGEPYLVDVSIQSLAGDIDAKPAGNFALSDNYNARKDGTYNGSPVAIEFMGNFDGLGNTVSNLKINSGEGLFYEATGTLRNIHLVNVSVTGPDVDENPVGALVGWELGSVEGATSSGSVSSSGSADGYPVGGLIGDGNIVTNCSSTATVQSDVAQDIGGLVGAVGTVSYSSASGPVTGAAESEPVVGGLAGLANSVVGSFATGAVTVTGSGYVARVGGLVGMSDDGVSGSFANGDVSAPDGAAAGGLVGYAYEGAIANSYATGAISGGSSADVGGLIGEVPRDTKASIATSYSTGAPSGGANSWIGGVLGIDDTKYGCGCFTDTYWDTTSSGITDLEQGAGFPPNEPGIAGLTTALLQSGLPAGFDPSVWAENPDINDGLPYLIATPPPN